MVFCRRTESSSRPTNGRRIILASFPVLHNRRFAMLPFALKGYLPPPQVPFGVLDLGNGCCHLSVELSRAVSSNAGSAATSQSPELGDLLQKSIPLRGCPLGRSLPGVAIAQRLVHFAAYPQAMQQNS